MSKEKETFEKNGGYFIDGKAYMDCKITGEPVPNVKQISSLLLVVEQLNGIMKQFLTEKPNTNLQETRRMDGEFVDKDGNVFHKGKEQPKLKGTLPPTKVEPKKKKTKRRTKQQILLDRQKEKKAALRKAVQKQKDFINKHTG